MSDAVLELEDVAVARGRRRVLDGLSLTVPRGAVYALLGRNGAGKTTAIACLLGLLRPDRGRARLFGADAWVSRAAAMSRLGFVPDVPCVPAGLTARVLGAFSAPFYPRWDAAGYAARLRRFEVPPDVRFAQLSRGQKTQVALALALAPSPEALVLDEPTLGLDPVARAACLSEVIGDLADRGTTILVATHDLAAIEGLATHVGILDAGRLAEGGELEELKQTRGKSLERIFTDTTTDGSSKEAA